MLKSILKILNNIFGIYRAFTVHTFDFIFGTYHKTHKPLSFSHEDYNNDLSGWNIVSFVFQWGEIFPILLTDRRIGKRDKLLELKKSAREPISVKFLLIDYTTSFGKIGLYQESERPLSILLDIELSIYEDSHN